jgi:hypothetical protein
MFVTKTHLHLLARQCSDKTTNELLLDISSVIKNALMSVQKKRNNSKRLSHGAINKLQTTHEGAYSLIALVNQRHHTNFWGFEEMHVHLQIKAEMAENKWKKTCLNIQSLKSNSSQDYWSQSEPESDWVSANPDLGTKQYQQQKKHFQ